MRLRTVVTFLAASAMLLAADVTGTWSFAVETGAGSGTPSFTFVQKGTALTGTYQGMVGEAPLAQSFAAALDARGIMVSAFFFPVVPRGQARIRTQMNAALTREDLDFALTAFAEAGRETGVLA